MQIQGRAAPYVLPMCQTEQRFGGKPFTFAPRGATFGIADHDAFTLGLSGHNPATVHWALRPIPTAPVTLTVAPEMHAMVQGTLQVDGVLRMPPTEVAPAPDPQSKTWQFTLPDAHAALAGMLATFAAERSRAMFALCETSARRTFGCPSAHVSLNTHNRAIAQRIAEVPHSDVAAIVDAIALAWQWGWLEARRPICVHLGLHAGAHPAAWRWTLIDECTHAADASTRMHRAYDADVRMMVDPVQMAITQFATLSDAPLHEASVQRLQPLVGQPLYFLIRYATSPPLGARQRNG